MHLFPGGCLLSVLTTRYRLEADVTVKIEKQLLLLSSGEGEREGGGGRGLICSLGVWLRRVDGFYY